MGHRHAGAYRSPVTVTFHCTKGTAPLTHRCPKAVHLRAAGTHRVRKTIHALDAGTATVTRLITIRKT